MTLYLEQQTQGDWICCPDPRSERPLRNRKDTVIASLFPLFAALDFFFSLSLEKTACFLSPCALKTEFARGMSKERQG